jgi:hypothetical protein
MTPTPDPEREAARQAAITDAEIREIVRALKPYGVLDRATLSAETRQRGWQPGAFDAALAAAVRQGVIEPLPDGHYKLPED